jgi:Rrf2 family protein
MISRTSEYGLRATLYLARQPADQLASAAEIAKALSVPSNYLSKLLHTLSKNGILEAERGPRGGYRLAVPATELSLASVVELFQDLRPERACLLGRTKCLDENPCAAHERWKSVFDEVSSFLDKTMIADLLESPTPARTE